MPTNFGNRRFVLTEGQARLAFETVLSASNRLRTAREWEDDAPSQDSARRLPFPVTNSLFKKPGQFQINLLSDPSSEFATQQRLEYSDTGGRPSNLEFMFNPVALPDPPSQEPVGAEATSRSTVRTGRPTGVTVIFNPNAASNSTQQGLIENISVEAAHTAQALDNKLPAPTRGMDNDPSLRLHNNEGLLAARAQGVSHVDEIIRNLRAAATKGTAMDLDRPAFRASVLLETARRARKEIERGSRVEGPLGSVYDPTDAELEMATNLAREIDALEKRIRRAEDMIDRSDIETTTESTE